MRSFTTLADLEKGVWGVCTSPNILLVEDGICECSPVRMKWLSIRKFDYGEPVKVSMDFERFFRVTLLELIRKAHGTGHKRFIYELEVSISGQKFICEWEVFVAENTLNVHKDIRILFEVEGCQYEAVGGFINDEDKGRVSGHTMVERTSNENGGIITDNPLNYPLCRKGVLISRDLRPYKLVTNYTSPEYPRSNYVYYWDDFRTKWQCDGRYTLDRRDYDDSYLVVRRLGVIK